MKRRGLRRVGTALILALLLAGCRGSSSGGAGDAGAGDGWQGRLAPGPRPNVLLVVYDARRADDFSFGPRGNRRNDTPFLAAFARAEHIVHRPPPPSS